MLEFSERFDKEKYGRDGGPLHDPCVIAYLLQPDLFKGRHVEVEIETASELTLGMTVVDWWGVTASGQRHGDQPDRPGRLLRTADRTAGAPLMARKSRPLIRSGQCHVRLNRAALHRFLAGGVPAAGDLVDDGAHDGEQDQDQGQRVDGGVRPVRTLEAI